jgi:hypothetical protein
MNLIKYIVTSCIHLIKTENKNKITLASGVIIQFKKRHFLCTAEHFVNNQAGVIGIINCKNEDGEYEIYKLTNFRFSVIIEIEDEMDIEDIQYCILNPTKSGKLLDIAISELYDINAFFQTEVKILDNEIGEFIIEEGKKNIINIDNINEIIVNEEFSFFGRIQPELRDKELLFREQLFPGLTFKGQGKYYYEFDLGESIKDGNRFRGCSGAPILDTNGNLVAIVTHGSKRLEDSSIFGIRIDKIREIIELGYFAN